MHSSNTRKTRRISLFSTLTLSHMQNEFTPKSTSSCYARLRLSCQLTSFNERYKHTLRQNQILFVYFLQYSLVYVWSFHENLTLDKLEEQLFFILSTLFLLPWTLLDDKKETKDDLIIGVKNQPLRRNRCGFGTRCADRNRNIETHGQKLALDF